MFIRKKDFKEEKVETKAYINIIDARYLNFYFLFFTIFAFTIPAFTFALLTPLNT